MRTKARATWQETSKEKGGDVGRLLYPDEPGCTEFRKLFFLLLPLLLPVESEKVRRIVVLVEHVFNRRLNQVTYLK